MLIPLPRLPPSPGATRGTVRHRPPSAPGSSHRCLAPTCSKTATTSTPDWPSLRRGGVSWWRKSRQPWSGRDACQVPKEVKSLAQLMLCRWTLGSAVVLRPVQEPLNIPGVSIVTDRRDGATPRRLELCFPLSQCFAASIPPNDAVRSRVAVTHKHGDLILRPEKSNCNHALGTVDVTDRA